MSDETAWEIEVEKAAQAALTKLEMLQRLKDTIGDDMTAAEACASVVAFLREIGRDDVATAFEELVPTEA